MNVTDSDVDLPELDTTAPDVSIAIPSGIQNGAFEVTIVFTEAVSDFVQADLSLTGSARASITAWTTTDNITYTPRITPTTSGEVILSIASEVATDAANNANTVATSQTIHVDVDAPTVTIDVPLDTQTGDFDVTVTFSESVLDFEQSDLTLTGDASVSATAWSANTEKTMYTATITPTTSGEVILDVAANVATDGANNPNTAATSQTVNVDVDPPDVSISVPEDAQNGAFDATITFTETVSGFVQADFSLSGDASASVTAWSANTENTVFTATITPTTSGEAILDVAANVATDAEGNPNTAATSQTLTVDIDKPSVTISVPSDVQNGAFEATVTFTEIVSGFEQDDLSLSGTSSATITAWKNTDGTIYTAEITPTTSGQVVVSIAADVATDTANNPNTAANSQTVSVDVDRPGVSISVPSGEQTGEFEATITFTEVVSDFEQADLSIVGTANATITSWETSDNLTYTAEITASINGQVTLSVPAGVATDEAENLNTAATPHTVNVELDSPELTIQVPSEVQTGLFTVVIRFTEPVIGFEQTDLSITGTANASITAWSAPTGNWNNILFVATITPTTSGELSFSVPAGVATNSANRLNTAAITRSVTVSLETATGRKYQSA